jgi:hypothetical protein
MQGAIVRFQLIHSLLAIFIILGLDDGPKWRFCSGEPDSNSVSLFEWILLGHFSMVCIIRNVRRYKASGSLVWSCHLQHNCEIQAALAPRAVPPQASQTAFHHARGCHSLYLIRRECVHRGVFLLCKDASEADYRLEVVVRWAVHKVGAAHILIHKAGLRLSHAC